MGIQCINILKKQMNKKKLKVKFNIQWLLYLLILPVFYIGYKTNNELINSFGCFDDCHVFSTAYFMLQGKTIYSEVFFNHNPFMPYFSYLIQYIYEPKSVYELLLRHRQLLFIVSVILNVFLLFRFRYKALGFIILYELTKFYTFGNRFLPEAIIVYFVVFLFGLVWEKIKNAKITKIDYVASALATWFIIFMREPYVPLAIFLYGTIIWRFDRGWKLISFMIFLVLCTVTLLTLPVHDFYFNVITFNLSETVSQEISKNTFFGIDILKIIFYPFYILFPVGNFGYYRNILILESVIFVTLLILNLKNFSKKQILFLFLTLGLSNIRFTLPGVAFYGAYHMNVWYAIFIFSLMFLIASLESIKIRILAVVVFIFIVLLALSKDSIVWQRVDQQEQLLTNYGTQMLYAQIINELSSPMDTLFLDGWDELIYSQTKLTSSYKYSHYTSQMPRIQEYRNAREEMFKAGPPVFYYGTCKEDVGQKLPDWLRGRYVRVYHMGKPTCLYVLKKKYEKIKNTDENVTFHDK